jgi:crossover junction endodeoxyribonuclease RuvC
MRILGIDPGSRVIGFALIGPGERNSIINIVSGAQDFSNVPYGFDRLKNIQQFVKKMLIKLKPDEVSLELPIFNKNPDSLIKLTQARGVIISCLLEAVSEKRIFEYSPNTIKKVVSGYGHSSKQEILKSIHWYPKSGINEKKITYFDESDACSIALCHHFMRKKHDRISGRKSCSLP